MAATPPPLPKGATRRGGPAFGYPPPAMPWYVRRCATRPSWPGPFYLLASAWQGDLGMVMEQIRCCVRANVPLSTGLEAAVLDRAATYQDWSPEKWTRAFRFVGFVLIFFTSVGISKALHEANEGAVVLWIAPPLLAAAWCYFAVFHRYLKPIAVLARLQGQTEQGMALSEAMASMPRFFPEGVVSLVRAGERTGDLGGVLERFNDTTIRALGMQQAFDRTLRYLGANLAVVCCLAIVLFVKCLPMIAEVDSEFNVPSRATVPGILLPVPTLSVLLRWGAFLVQHVYVPVGLLVLVLLASVLFLRRKRGHWPRTALASCLMVLPGIRGMVAAENLGLAATILYHLLRAGVPLPEALGMVAEGDIHPWYKRWFHRLRGEVEQGETLADACAKHDSILWVPRSFRGILAMGGGGEHLVDGIAWIGVQYQESFERRYRFLIGLVLPAGIFALGYLVLAIEAATFYALASMAEALIV